MNFFRGFFKGPKEDVEWFKTLQQRIEEKNKFFQNIHNNMADFNTTLNESYNNLKAKSKNFEKISHTLEDQYLYDTYKLFQIKIVEMIKAETEFMKNSIEMLKAHLSKYENEMKIYNKLKDLKAKLDVEKKYLKNNKTEYHKSAIDMENKVKKFVESNFNDMDNLPEPLNNQLISFIKNPKKLLKKYKDSVNNTNELSINFNQKQNELYSILPNFGNKDNEIFSNFANNFLNSLQKNLEFLDLTKNNMNTIQKNERKDDLNNLIKEALNNKKEEKKIELIQYQSGLEFIKCKDEKEFNLSAKIVETINKKMEDEIFPNYNYEADLKNFHESKLIKKLFEMEEIDENSEKELLNSLDDKKNHKAMFVVLSQLRTNSTFKRPKSFIKVFGEAFNKMILMANQEEIYDYVKNSIILSQTYFYPDEEDKNKKRYLFEQIKSNKILNNSHFWRNFIDSMIKMEYQRFKMNHGYPDYNIENINEIPPKIKNKLNEIAFSQLLSFITNLNDFEIDKRVILKIVDEFINKYNFLSESNIKDIYAIISKDKDVIEQLRKEYDPSLESEIIEFKGEKKINEEKEKDEIKTNEEKEKNEIKAIEEKEKDEIKTNEENENKND